MKMLSINSSPRINYIGIQSVMIVEDKISLDRFLLF